MKNWPPITEEHAGLTYRLSFERPQTDAPRIALLTLPGEEPVPFAIMGEDGGSEDQPAKTLEEQIRGVQAQARREVALAAELLADAERGWTIPLKDGLNPTLRWVIRTLDRRRIPFQTGWLPCHCESTRSRLRTGEGGGYQVHSQAVPFDWERLAGEVVRAQMGWIEAVPHPEMRAAMYETLSAKLVTRCSTDPAVSAIALHGSTFELTARRLDDAWPLLLAEDTDLHGQVREQWEQMGEVMQRHAEAMFSEMPGGTPDMPMNAPELLFDDDDGEEDFFEWHEQVRRRAPKIVHCSNQEEVSAQWMTWRLMTINESLPLPALRLTDPGGMTHPGFLHDLTLLLTADEETAETVSWISRRDSSVHPQEMLWWLWNAYDQGDDAPGELYGLFSDLQDLIDDRAKRPFHSSETFYSYVMAQLSANGYREVHLYAGGQPAVALIMHQALL